MVVIADISMLHDENDDMDGTSIEDSSFSLQHRHHPQSLLYTRSTTTTEQQIQTEYECKPYLNLLDDTESHHSESLEYFMSRGLIYQRNDSNNNEEEEEEDGGIVVVVNDKDHDVDNVVDDNATNIQKRHSRTTTPSSSKHVRLLRNVHSNYLHTVFRNNNNNNSNKLPPSFVSLDSSHTWMIYWCLHGLDILGKFCCLDSKIDSSSHYDGIEISTLQQQQQGDGGSATLVNDEKNMDHSEHLLLVQRILRTIQSCFSVSETVTITKDVVISDHILSSQLVQQQQDADINNKHEECVTFYNVAGGFGGGPYQLPHAATTYAAVMSLCIIAAAASSSSSSSSSTHDDNDHHHISNPAFQYLLSIRASLYVFFASLYNPLNGSFRMHMDGEMDIRATYCVYSVLHLLQMIPVTTTSNNDVSSSLSSLLPSMFSSNNTRISDYIWSCQSKWEGGFGGEPGAEAHGGYTYCAVAALYLFQQQSNPNLRVLRPIVTTTTATITKTSRQFIWNNESRRLELCRTWLRQRQMSYEGGFSGRINKLVDGCYSFWQGAASVIVQEQQRQQLEHFLNNDDGVVGSNLNITDPWISTQSETTTYSSCKSMDKGRQGKDSTEQGGNPDCDPFNALMLEKYILLCTQDENGGLRDKPSKGRDFYHTCYCLSGLSIAQHYGNKSNARTAFNVDTWTHKTHPIYNIRVEYVAFCQSYFGRIAFGVVLLKKDS